MAQPFAHRPRLAQLWNRAAAAVGHNMGTSLMMRFLERSFAAGVVTASLFFGGLALLSLFSTPAAAVAKGTSTAVETSVSGEVVKKAKLAGRGGKRARGDVSLEKTADGRYLIRLSGDFSLSRVPDPTIGFAKGGRYVSASEFTELKSFRGEQVYEVPAAIDPTEFDGLFLWCRRFSIPLAVAKLG